MATSHEVCMQSLDLEAVPAEFKVLGTITGGVFCLHVALVGFSEVSG